MRAPLIVLKFGGSVLADASTLPLVVQEIYRWRREGHDVVAVVSAFAGVTDALLRGARAACERPAPHALAAVVANGELHSASELALALDAAGVPARMLSPAALRLVADGDPLDAQPVDLDEALVDVALEAGEVVVVPGFVAVARDGRSVLLGRGGSDLTALFLAARLHADRCRLVKDVDGLYDRDPAARAGPAVTAAGTAAPAGARRYAEAGWQEALATDGSILQRKALHFARSHGRHFELGCRNGVRPTRIGRADSRSVEGPPERPTRRRVALLGLGTVGSAVCRQLHALSAELELVACGLRDPRRAGALALPAGLRVCDVQTAAASGADIVVELLGGEEPARTLMLQALRAGSHVVTANKAVLASHGAELSAFARAQGRRLLWSAAAGGAVPVLEAVSAAARSDTLLRVEAVLNGTSNFVLDAVARGDSLEHALRAAQQAGLAERDSRRDLSGRDAADKLVLVHHAVTGEWLPPQEVDCVPLTARTLEDARRPGAVVRQLATWEVTPEGCRACVRPQALLPGHPLFGLPGEGNAAVLQGARGIRVIRGRGAGGGPAATAVLGDLLELSRSLPAPLSGPDPCGSRPQAELLTALRR